MTVNRPLALLALSAVLLIASFPVDGPHGVYGIALVLAAAAASALAYRLRHELVLNPQVRAARAEFFAARTELAAVSDRDRWESDAYLAANGAVIAAEKRLTWRQRIDIELGCSPAIRTPKGATTCPRCGGHGYGIWVEAGDQGRKTGRCTCIECEGVGWI